ncbi:hypothetical protein B484DRAFT_412033 [Ochromonadaceae sp. CCMP2298]|nr:hypothetical protein B484DRAFT_412033 [Ochromonadaceae sp. CCMP2298]
MDGTDQLRLWAQWPDLLDLVYLVGDEDYEQDRCNEYEAIVYRFRQIFRSLNRKEDFTEPQIRVLQREMDVFCTDYVDGFSKHDVTNYIHVLQSGEIRYFLRRYGSLYRHANIGLEACVKVMRTASQRGTQHGGHKGNQRSDHPTKAGIVDPSNVARTQSLPRAMGLYMCRRASDQLGQFAPCKEDFIKELATNGKRWNKEESAKRARQGQAEQAMAAVATVAIATAH